MKHFHFFLFWVLILAFCLKGESQVKRKPNQKTNIADAFLVEKGKPSVYVTFERSGIAEPLFQGESDKRYWLKFRNNTKGNVSFRYSNIDKKYGDLAIHYDIEENKNFRSSVVLEEKPPPMNTSEETLRQEEAQRQNEIPSNGNATGHACLLYDLPAGKSVLFSIPKEHLVNNQTNFRIKISFAYEWEKEGSEFGSHPAHFTFFSYENLPSGERR